MYTLILIVIGFGATTTPASTVAVTHYTVGIQATCEKQRSALMSQNTKDSSVILRVYCVSP